MLITKKKLKIQKERKFKLKKHPMVIFDLWKLLCQAGGYLPPHVNYFYKL
jgi:hypothetical protein